MDFGEGYASAVEFQQRLDGADQLLLVIFAAVDDEAAAVAATALSTAVIITEPLQLRQAVGNRERSPGRAAPQFRILACDSPVVENKIPF